MTDKPNIAALRIDERLVHGALDQNIRSQHCDRCE